MFVPSDQDVFQFFYCDLLRSRLDKRLYLEECYDCTITISEYISI